MEVWPDIGFWHTTGRGVFLIPVGVGRKSVSMINYGCPLLNMANHVEYNKNVMTRLHCNGKWPTFESRLFRCKLFAQTTQLVFCTDGSQEKRFRNNMVPIHFVKSNNVQFRAQFVARVTNKNDDINTRRPVTTYLWHDMNTRRPATTNLWHKCRCMFIIAIRT